MTDQEIENRLHKIDSRMAQRSHRFWRLFYLSAIIIIALAVVAVFLSCSKSETWEPKACWKCWVGPPSNYRVDTNCTLGGRPYYTDSLGGTIPSDCIIIKRF